jgi:AcrR family transcriptional regulator
MDDIIVKVSDLYLKYGIKSVTMDDVARELGISKKTLYLHFKDKDELVKKVVDYHMDVSLAEMRNLASKKINAIEELLMLSQYLSQFLKQINPSVTYDLQKYYPEIWKNIATGRRDHIYKQIKENMKRGIKEGFYRSDQNIDIIAYFYLFRMEMSKTLDLIVENKYSFEEIFNTLFSYHIRGIANQKGIEYLECKIKNEQKKSIK